MTEYSPPVSELLTLGRPDLELQWLDYASRGITAADIPQLIALVQDQDLARGEEPEFFAQVHAWRALGQLRAEAAIEPLLDRLADEDNRENWNDWLTEEGPEVLGMIGPAAIPAIAAQAQRDDSQGWAACYYAHALKEIAQHHPESRERVVQELIHIVENAANLEPDVNGCIIGYLLEMNATEAWPVIEAAFAAGNVDEFIVGDAAEVKFQLGLGPKPPPRSRFPQLTPPPGGLSPKARAEKRKRERKARKQKRKQRSR